MMQTLSILLAALCITELAHNAIEIWGMRQKVEWLVAAMGKTAVKPWPININTKLKTVILHALILLVAGGGSFLVLKFLSLETTSYLLIGVISLVLNYIHTTWKVDLYHSEIGRIISEQKRKQ